MYLDTVVGVLLQDFLSVLVCVEGIHEDQGHVGVVCFVQVLQVKKKKIMKRTRRKKGSCCKQTAEETSRRLCEILIVGANHILVHVYVGHSNDIYCEARHAFLLNRQVGDCRDE